MEEEFVLINPKTKLKTQRKQLHPKKVLPEDIKKQRALRKTKKVITELELPLANPLANPALANPIIKQDISVFENKLSTLNDEYVTNKCSTNPFSSVCNIILRNTEDIEREYLEQYEDNLPNLYPTLNDPNFNSKIAEKKEFQDTQYDGNIYDIESHALELSEADYELSPHQVFVKNFLSFQTPYNSLLLYHGLGSGKTCSAIGVSEEMRDYLKQIGHTKKIIIVANPNVLSNFRIQLFDKKYLKEQNGKWTISGCIGNKLLKEINPMDMVGLTAEKIISQVNNLIKTHYSFMGYIKFSNYIEHAEKLGILNQEFDDRLIIIDEVHNIRTTDDNKIVSDKLMKAVKQANNIRLLLLSATPMFNSYKEIIWLINLMNINDRRSTIALSDIFDKSGHFKVGGKELLIQKATGYISYVRGENPYTFPYRIYPSIFDINNTFERIPYPEFQMNGKRIKETDAIKILSLYLLPIGEYQSYGYKYIINNLKNKKIKLKKTKMGNMVKMPTFENMDSFGYTLLQIPLESLNIIYPMEGLEEMAEQDIILSKPVSGEIEREELSEEELSDLDELSEDEEDEEEDDDEEKEALDKEKIEFSRELGLGPSPATTYGSINPSEITGHKGLSRMMNFIDSNNPPKKGDFEYKPQSPHIFAYDEIGKYSCKIKAICKNIVDGAEGILLIYSQYLDGGLIPMALALEEIGLKRYKDGNSLFKTGQTVKHGNPLIKGGNSYAMITGDPRISPNNKYEIDACTNKNNLRGEKIRVILISTAGSEGIDLKFIRQVHIMEPWYNINKIEQIVGRAVRNFSHKDLPFEERNVQIFMYGTLLQNGEEEAADIYVYRAAEQKAVKLGKVTRVLKESAVDCVINSGQNNFTQEKMDTEVKQVLSSKQILPAFKVGDVPYSATCDYMGECEYECTSANAGANAGANATNIKEMKTNIATYNESYVLVNSDKIISKIKLLMKEKYFYSKYNLIHMINVPKEYHISQIYASLTQMIDNKEYITDKYGRIGYLVNIGQYYLFQPIELNNKNIPIYDRMVPIDYKFDSVLFDMKESKKEDKVKVKEPVKIESTEIVESKEIVDASKLLKEIEHNYTIAIMAADSSDNIHKTRQKDVNWYDQCGITMKNLIKEGYKVAIINTILIEHIADMLDFKDKLLLYQYFFSNAVTPKLHPVITNIKKYLEESIIKTPKLIGVVLFNKNKEKVYILNNYKWTLATPLQKNEILGKIVTEPYFRIDNTKLNTIMGYISYDDKYDYNFKIKNIDLKRHTGANCDQMNKDKKIAILNSIIGYEKYKKYDKNDLTVAVTKERREGDTSGMIKEQICSLIEFTMRYYTKELKDGRIWFINNDKYILNKIDL